MPVHGSEQVAYSQDRVGTAEPAFSRRGRRGIGWWRWRLGCVVIGVIASIDELMDLDFDVDAPELVACLEGDRSETQSRTGERAALIVLGPQERNVNPLL